MTVRSRRSRICSGLETLVGARSLPSSFFDNVVFLLDMSPGLPNPMASLT